jgi:hypothetical protein
VENGEEGVRNALGTAEIEGNASESKVDDAGAMGGLVT